ncbi:MAG: hypothetical protein JXB23_17710, partial [Candidatus Aminicenantes bacterium]|nr:hypothetical protein [Candidatus Aminicenantes bacterium]
HDLGYWLSQIGSSLDPVKFYSGFNPDESIWELDGDVYIAGPSGGASAGTGPASLPPSSENEWELHATGEGRAEARIESLFDPIIWNMRILVLSGWCEADLGYLAGKRFLLRIYPSHIQILKHKRPNPKVVAEVEIPLTVNPWKFIQVEKILSDFKIAWNGRELFSFKIPDGYEFEFRPKFSFPGGAEVMVYLDDVMAVQVQYVP